jgi:hypothetical protein
MYLGYYVGEIDGIWGQMSEEATKAFQRDYDGLKADGIAGPNTTKSLKHAVAYGMPAKKEPKNFWEDVKHFKRNEFKCRCGGKHCNGFPAEPSEKLVRLADRVREHFGAPAIVSSGVRCEKHNAKVGGVTNSRHKTGTAMDFCIKGMPSSVVLAYVQKQSATHYAYAIDGSYVHMDVVE